MNRIGNNLLPISYRPCIGKLILLKGDNFFGFFMWLFNLEEISPPKRKEILNKIFSKLPHLISKSFLLQKISCNYSRCCQIHNSQTEKSHKYHCQNENNILHQSTHKKRYRTDKPKNHRSLTISNNIQNSTTS